MSLKQTGYKLLCKFVSFCKLLRFCFSGGDKFSESGGHLSRALLLFKATVLLTNCTCVLGFLGWKLTLLFKLVYYIHKPAVLFLLNWNIFPSTAQTPNNILYFLNCCDFLFLFHSHVKYFQLLACRNNQASNLMLFYCWCQNWVVKNTFSPLPKTSPWVSMAKQHVETQS